MTREEAIKLIKEQIDLYEWQAEDINAMVNPRRYDEYQNTINSLKMAIKALEQEPVLGKIRAEIMKLQTYKMFYGEDTVYVERDDVLEIIDRYKAESEDKG